MKVIFKYKDVKYSLEDCEPSWKIEKLIEKIKEKLEAKGQSVEDVELTFKGETLKTEDTIKKAGLSDGCTVDVKSQQTSKMKVNFKYQYSLEECEQEWKIKKLLKEIKEKMKAEGESDEDLELTFKGKTLKTEDTIKKAGLPDGCTVDAKSQQTSGVTENEPSKHSTVNFKYQYSLEDCEQEWKIEKLLEEIKEKLKAAGKSDEDLELTLKGKTLKTDKTLKEAGVSDGSTVDVISQTSGVTGNEPSRHRTVEIWIKKPDGENMSMDVELRWTQSDFKQKVSALINIHVDQLVLKYGSTVLEGEDTLREAGIREGCTVLAIARVRGGGSNQ